MMDPMIFDSVNTDEKMTSTPRHGSNWRVPLRQGKKENEQDREKRTEIQRTIHDYFPQLSSDPSVGTHMMASIHEVLRENDTHGSIESLASQPAFGSRLFFSNNDPWSIVLLREQSLRRLKGGANSVTEWTEINILLREVSPWFPIETANYMDNPANLPRGGSQLKKAQDTESPSQGDNSEASSTSTPVKEGVSHAGSGINFSASSTATTVDTISSRPPVRKTVRETGVSRRKASRKVVDQTLVTATRVAKAPESYGGGSQSMSQERDKPVASSLTSHTEAGSQNKSMPIDPDLHDPPFLFAPNKHVDVKKRTLLVSSTQIGKQVVMDFINTSPHDYNPHASFAPAQRSDVGQCAVHTSPHASSSPKPHIDKPFFVRKFVNTAPDDFSPHGSPRSKRVRFNEPSPTVKDTTSPPVIASPTKDFDPNGMKYKSIYPYPPPSRK